MTIEELQAENARLKAEVAKWQRCESVACDKMLELCGEIKVLKAEVERLTAENEAVKLGNKEWRQTAIERGEMNAEDANAIGLLKAEVERLTKAGDAMACHFVCSDLPNDVCGDLMKNWNAAKEGKQP